MSRYQEQQVGAQGAYEPTDQEPLVGQPLYGSQMGRSQQVVGDQQKSFVDSVMESITGPAEDWVEENAEDQALVEKSKCIRCGICCPVLCWQYSVTVIFTLLAFCSACMVSDNIMALLKQKL